ncbi:MAG: hypothetical protein R3Y21_04875 [Mycoplasmatota bacterium]
MDFIKNGINYPNIRRCKNILFKKTTLCKESWQYIKKQNFSFVVNPITIEEQIITLPYLSDHQSLYDSKRDFSTKAIYILLIRQLKYLISLHKKGIIHGDIFSLNIMVDEVLNLKLIDFDYSIVKGKIPEENIYFYDEISNEEKIELTKKNDIKDTLLTYLYFLANNSFSDDIVDFIDFKALQIDENLKNKLKLFFEKGILPDDYFTSDFVILLEKS